MSPSPYGPIAAALRGLHRDPALTGWLDRQRLQGLSPVLPQADEVPEPAGGPQTRTLELLLELLGRLTEQQPVVLAIEDVHWSDLASLDVLAFLIQNLGQSRLEVAITFRSDELTSTHPLRGLLAVAAANPRVSRIDLRPLDMLDTAALVQLMLPAADEQRRADVVRRSGGNPFLAEVLGSADGPLPETLRDHVAARLRSLPTSARRLLELLSAGGHQLPMSVLERACSLSQKALAEATRVGVGVGLLIADPSRPLVAFRHALLAEVIYDALLPSERQELHATLAAALQVPGRDLDSTCAGSIAEQWCLAERPGQALRPLLVAARAAAGRQAHSDAAALFSQAAAIWPQVPDAAAVAGIGAAELYLEHAESIRWSAGPAPATALALKALDTLPLNNSDELESRAWERVARYQWEQGNGQESLAAARRGCAVLQGHGPSKEHARALSALAAISMLRGEFQSSIEVAGRAVDMARALSAATELSYALNTMGTSLACLGNVDDGLAALQEALRTARNAGALEDVCRAYNNLAYVLDLADRLDESLEVATDGLIFTRRYGLGHSAGATLRSNAASTLMTLGRWVEADALITESTDKLVPSGHQLYLDLIKADLDIARGVLRDPGMLDAFAARVGALDEPWTTGLLASCRAEVLLWRHRSPAALQASTTVLDALVSAQESQLAVRLAALALRAIANGRRDPAVRGGPGADVPLKSADLVMEAIEPFRQQASCAISVALCDAEYRRISAPVDCSPWWDVVERARLLGRPYQLAYGAWRLAEAQHRIHDPKVAGSIRQAAVTARALGAGPLLERIEAFAVTARVALQPSEVRAFAGKDPLNLTPRERQVLRALQSGASNRHIARSLGITEKTAGVHVGNILGKLGVQSRTQAAALAHQFDDRTTHLSASAAEQPI